jgi:hypothetical protein
MGNSAASIAEQTVSCNRLSTNLAHQDILGKRQEPAGRSLYAAHMISSLTQAEIYPCGRKIHLCYVVNVDVSFFWFTYLGVGNIVSARVPYRSSMGMNYRLLRLPEQ